jgi:magnesium transporter
MDVDYAHYEHGVRQDEDPVTLAEAATIPRHGGSFVWLELHEPTPEAMDEARRHFALHELAVEDAGQAHQRPKVEEYDGFHLIVYKTARYEADGDPLVDFGELEIFLGPGFLIVVRHGAAGDSRRARARAEAHPELLKTGAAAAVWAVLDVVVDDYAPVVEGLADEIEDLERAVFSGGDEEDLTERFYLLKRELNEVYRAVHPLLGPLEAIERGQFPQMDSRLAKYFRDIADHVRHLQEEVLAQRDLLANALEANLSLVNVRQSEVVAQQNQVVKQLTLVATVFLPLTFVTGFFGQNFGWMVEHIASSTAFVLGGIGGLAVPCVALFVWFRRGGYAA